MDIEDIKSKIVSEVLAVLTPKTRALEGEIQTLKQTIVSALEVMQQKARISIERDLSGIIDAKLAAVAEGVRAEAEQAAAEKLAAARHAKGGESALFQSLQAVDRGSERRRQGGVSLRRADGGHHGRECLRVVSGARRSRPRVERCGPYGCSRRVHPRRPESPPAQGRAGSAGPFQGMGSGVER